MKAVSIISIVYGTLGLIWVSVASALIRVQKAFFENFPFPDEVYDYIDIDALLETVYSMMGFLFPFVFVIGIIYILSGILHLAGNSSFRTIAYIAAILNIIWYTAYVVLVQVELVPMINSMEVFPGNLMSVFIIFGMLINAVFYCGYPIFLLIYLKKGPGWDTLDTGYQS